MLMRQLIKHPKKIGELRKWVICWSGPSEFWAAQFDTLKEAKECLERHGGTNFHIEHWVYPEYEDGHAKPSRIRLENMPKNYRYV